MNGEANLTFDGNDLTLGNGNIVFGTAAKGVYLGVTSATASNLLDDYEEGSFAPTFSVDISGTAPSSQSGSGAYTKIGDMVHVHGQINWSGSGSGGTRLKIDLPFQCISARGALSVGLVSGFNWSSGNQLTMAVEGGQSKVYLLEKNPTSGGHVHLTFSSLTTTGSYLFSFCGAYNVA